MTPPAARKGRLVALLVAVSAVGCAADPALYPLPTDPPELLSAWAIFSDLPTLTPGEGVQGYDVISPLFSDYAIKYRHLAIPEGTTIGYDERGEWTFPVGTVLVKTFGFLADARDESAGRHILETRLLVRGAEGWEPHTYVWNEAQTDAERLRVGATIPIAWIDDAGTSRSTDYVVPNTNECHECHGEGESLDTLGGTSRNLDRDYDYAEGRENQIAHFARLGLFDSAPPAFEERTRLVDPFGDAPVADRARSYFDVNCAMCHRADSAASNSDLRLDFWDTDPTTADPASYGVCKTPTSAGGATCGLTHDVVPGHPEMSIMSCRMRSTDPRVQMPPLGRTLAHDAGADLVDAWIVSLPAGDCTP